MTPDPNRPIAPNELTLASDPLRAGASAQLTPEQAQAARPDFQQAYPLTSAFHKYRTPWDPANAGSSVNTGRSVYNWLQKPNMLSKTMDAGALPGGLAGSLIGGGIGYLGGHVKNFLSDEGKQTNPATWALVSALLGAGVGGYIGHGRWNAKNSSMHTSKGRLSKADAATIINSVPGLSREQRMQYMAATSRMNSGELSELERLLRGAAGAGIGALLARFFFGKGLIRGGAGALFGGLVAALTSR